MVRGTAGMANGQAGTNISNAHPNMRESREDPARLCWLTFFLGTSWALSLAATLVCRRPIVRPFTPDSGPRGSILRNRRGMLCVVPCGAEFAVGQRKGLGGEENGGGIRKSNPRGGGRPQKFANPRLIANLGAKIGPWRIKCVKNSGNRKKGRGKIFSRISGTP